MYLEEDLFNFAWSLMSFINLDIQIWEVLIHYFFK